MGVTVTPSRIRNGKWHYVFHQIKGILFSIRLPYYFFYIVNFFIFYKLLEDTVDPIITEILENDDNIMESEIFDNLH